MYTLGWFLGLFFACYCCCFCEASIRISSVANRLSKRKILGQTFRRTCCLLLLTCVVTSTESELSTWKMNQNRVKTSKLSGNKQEIFQIRVSGRIVGVMKFPSSRRPSKKRVVKEGDPEDHARKFATLVNGSTCLLYTSPSPRDRTRSRMPSSA